MSRVLFILKRREDYNVALHSHVGVSTGLYNSAKFVNDMLNSMAIISKMVVVTDNNDIDREVTAFRPTHVIIEALWVVPSKFNILQKLHPHVKWIIRLHSELPFMAGEGNAMDWVGDYSTFRNVLVACNSPRMLEEIRLYLRVKNKWSHEKTTQHVVYLPNFYPQEYKTKQWVNYDKDTIDIGCFGAVRPLKNHLVQAFASIQFAEQIGKKLRFHINAGRVEMKGDSVMHNLKGLFQHLHNSPYELVNHIWTPREQFLELCAKMDIGLQVAFSETFNIVGADYVSQGTPLVGSADIPWIKRNTNSIADPTSSSDITNKLCHAYNNPFKCVDELQKSLTSYTMETVEVWSKYFICIS